MENKDLSIKFKFKLFNYLQLVKLTLGAIIFALSFIVLEFGKFDFYVPYLAAAMAVSGFISYFISQTIDKKYKWLPYFTSTVDIGAFLFCIYISQFIYNTLFFWLGGLLVFTYFVTHFHFALFQLAIALTSLLVWTKTGIFSHNIVATDMSYTNAFILSVAFNLIYVFSTFYFNEKIKNEYNNQLLKANDDIESISSFHIHNPHPIFEYTSTSELLPKNKIAREYVLFAESRQLEELINFADQIKAKKSGANRILKLTDKDFKVVARFVGNKVNLYLTDISELLETKREYQEKEQYNRAIIDAIPGFVSWIDHERRYLGVNDHMCDFFDRPQEEFLNKTIGEIAEDDDKMIANLVEHLFIGDEELLQKEFSFQHQGQTFWSYITLKKYNDGKNAVLVSTDITKLKEAERKVYEEQTKAQTNAKLAAFGEMAAGIAHEINNPLAILNGVGLRLRKLKEKDKLSDEKFFELTEKLFYGVDRVSKIINGMKNLSREGKNDPFEMASIKDILDDSLVLLSKKCLHLDIDLRINDIDENLLIQCQRVQISQILVILINNSIDAIKENEQQKWIKIHVQDKDHTIVLSVIDSGNGIDESIAQRIFEPFYTTKAVGKGTGLGLSLANKIIKSHHGQFNLDLEHKHTKFDIILYKEIPVKSVA